MQLFIHPLSINISTPQYWVTPWPLVQSHTHAYKLQFRVSNQPNVLVTGLWEEAEVPGEEQHRHRETLTKNRELYVVFYGCFVTTTL